MTQTIHLPKVIAILAVVLVAQTLIAAPSRAAADVSCAVELVVLGAGQDAGAPQIGNNTDPAWKNSSLRLTPSSVALIDHRDGRRFLFDATPAIIDQLALLDEIAPSEGQQLGIDGIFLTHAHIGHYAGLIYLGHEAAGTSGIPVYTMPRMTDYLSQNGPWSQLVNFNNIRLQIIVDAVPVQIGSDITVTPLLVPHRDEYSETVGFVIRTPGGSAIYLPDIDSWEEWKDTMDRDVTALAERLDYLFVDATFYSDDELPGRDMSVIPHPRVSGTMERFALAEPSIREKIHFIHYNHTNPVRFPDSKESKEVFNKGFNIARARDRVCLTVREN